MSRIEKQIFQLHDTHGYPILYIAEAIDEKGEAINWFKWMEHAISGGWSYEKISETITSINDHLYGNSWKHLKHYIPIMYIILFNKNTRLKG